MSGLDGRGFVDTAFLEPGWRLRGTVPASDVYSDSESAIWDLCPGCVDERGWLGIDNATGDMCPWMYQATEYDGKPMVDVWEGPDGKRFEQCHYRREPWIQEEEYEQCEGQQQLF